MTPDALLVAVVEALTDLVLYVQARSAEDMTDDDVRALEGVAHRLRQLPESDQVRLRPLLGHIVAEGLGLRG